MKYLLLCAAAALVGCATPLRPDQAEIRVLSNPIGATLTMQGQVVKAPHSWTWSSVHENMVSQPITATWMSGAATTFTLKLQPGTSKSYVAQRPPNAPGIHYDMQYAMALDAQNRASEAGMFQAMSEAAGALGGAIGTAARKK